MAAPNADSGDKLPDNHVSLARVYFGGDASPFWWITVHFSDATEIDRLIAALTQLRDDPQALRGHCHLQDHGLQRGDPPSAGEVLFVAPVAGTEWLVDEDLRRDGEAVMGRLRHEGYARAWAVEWVRGIRAALADEDPVSPDPGDSTAGDPEE